MELELRQWSAADAADLRRAVVTSPDVVWELGEDLGNDTACARFIENVLAAGGIPTVNWAICVDGTVVGNAGLSRIEHRHDTAWASYWVAEQHRGRGLATRALSALAAHAFHDLGLFRVELGHRTDNTASCRVAAKAGFAPEGIERSKLRYGDLRFDVETHARLVTDPDPTSSRSSGGTV